MANQCPNCDKPVRPGAKFCGFCGHVLSEADPGTKLNGAESHVGGTSPQMQMPMDAVVGGNPCPHCEKNNRPGVKFCANCGKALSTTAPTTPMPVSPQPMEEPTKRKRPRIVTIGFLVGVFVIVCASLLGIAYGFGLDDLVFPPDTPTSTILIEADQTATPVEVTLTLSTTPVPTYTETITPTPTQTPSETPLPTTTNTPTPEVVFDDDFQEGLEGWLPWQNRPFGISSDLLPADTFLGEYLDLKGLDYDRVGVTSVQTFTLESGLIIEFDAEVDNTAPLFFDWNPGDEVRPYDTLGPIYLQIEKSGVLFHYQKDGNEYNCQVDLPVESARTYRIEISPDWEVILYVGDEEFDEECRAFIDEPDQLMGRITFSGFGLVNRIIVTLP